jgi:hypothetical protein
MTHTEQFICKPRAITQDKRLSFAEQDYLCIICQLSQDGDCTAGNGWFADYFRVEKARASEIICSLRDKKIIKVDIERAGKQYIGRTIKIIDEGVKESFTGVSRKPLGGCKGFAGKGIKDSPHNRENKEENKYLYTLRDNSLWGLPEEKFLEYRTSFPGVDIHRELLKAHQWLLDNPSKRKTARGMFRFLSGWLGRVKPEQPLTPPPPAVNPEDTPGARRIREEARKKYLRTAQ